MFRRKEEFVTAPSLIFYHTISKPYRQYHLMCLGVWSLLGYVRGLGCEGHYCLTRIMGSLLHCCYVVFFAYQTHMGFMTMKPIETPTQTHKNPYPGYGCSVWWVRVWVALEYPRVICDNFYRSPLIIS